MAKRRPLFLVLIAIAAVAVVVPMTVFGLPYGRSNPEAFAHMYTAPNGNQTHLHIDADVTNGTRPCDPIDTTATVTIGDVHKVGVCIESYQPNSIGIFELHIRYTGNPDATPPTTINSAATIACGSTSDPACVDANPDANDGNDNTNGLTLGGGWDCTSFGLQYPLGEDPLTPGVADAIIVCMANLANPDQDLTADPGLLATITFTATGTGDDVIDFGPINSTNANAVGNPRPNNGFARCGTAVPADQVACFGATVHKMPPCDCFWQDDTGRGTTLCLQGSNWTFTYPPQGMLSGTGRVMRLLNRVIMVGRGQGFFVVAMGFCPAGPGTAIAYDFRSMPPQFLRLRDVTGEPD